MTLSAPKGTFNRGGNQEVVSAVTVTVSVQLGSVV